MAVAFGVAKVVLCLWLGALGADSDDYEGRGWPKCASFSKNKTNKTGSERGWPKWASFSKNKTNKTGSERGWPKWASFSKNKTNKTGSGRGWFSKNRTWPKWFSKNKTEVPTYPCGCRNWKGVLAPKVDLEEFSINADEKCERPMQHASMTPGKFCSCDKGRAANWDQAVSEAQKAVDDAVSPIVEEMMNAITALQEELGMIVDSSSMKKLKPKVTSFPRKQGEGLWVCCCQSGEAGKCRKDAEQTGWKAAHHEAPADACENEATEGTEDTEAEDEEQA